ncbi:hypothetical protein, partial [Streptomyces sp. HCCB10043]
MPEKLNQHRFRGMWGRRALLVATALLAGVLVPLGEAPADAAPADLAAQAAPAVPATPTAAAAAAS